MVFFAYLFYTVNYLNNILFKGKYKFKNLGNYSPGMCVPNKARVGLVTNTFKSRISAIVICCTKLNKVTVKMYRLG